MELPAKLNNDLNPSIDSRMVARKGKKLNMVSTVLLLHAGGQCLHTLAAHNKELWDNALLVEVRDTGLQSLQSKHLILTC